MWLNAQKEECLENSAIEKAISSMDPVIFWYLVGYIPAIIVISVCQAIDIRGKPNHMADMLEVALQTLILTIVWPLVALVAIAVLLAVSLVRVAEFMLNRMFGPVNE